MNTKLLGQRNEKKAKDYLIKKGYTILDTNYTTRIGEIDIVAKIDDCIVFVEVKSRKDDYYGSALYAVNKRKLYKYGLLMKQYLVNKNLTESPSRFDIIEITSSKLNHIENAYWDF